MIKVATAKAMLVIDFFITNSLLKKFKAFSFSTARRLTFASKASSRPKLSTVPLAKQMPTKFAPTKINLSLYPSVKTHEIPVKKHFPNANKVRPLP